MQRCPCACGRINYVFRYTTEKINLSLASIAFRLPSLAREAEPALPRSRAALCGAVLGILLHAPEPPKSQNHAARARKGQQQKIYLLSAFTIDLKAMILFSLALSVGKQSTQAFRLSQALSSSSYKWENPEISNYLPLPIDVVEPETVPSYSLPLEYISPQDHPSSSSSFLSA